MTIQLSNSLTNGSTSDTQVAGIETEKQSPQKEPSGLHNKDLIAEIGSYLKDPDFLALYVCNKPLQARLHAQLDARHERHQKMLKGQVLIAEVWKDAKSLFQADRVQLTSERILDQYELNSRDNLRLIEALLSRAISHMPGWLLDLTIKKMSELRPEDIQTLKLDGAWFSKVDLQTLLKSFKTLLPISARYGLSALIDALLTAGTLNGFAVGALLDQLKDQPRALALPTLLHLLHAFLGDDDHESALRRLLSQVQVMSLEEAEYVQMLMGAALLDEPQNAWCLDMLRSFCGEQPREFQAPLLMGEAFALTCLEVHQRFERFSDIRSRSTELLESEGMFDVWSALAANVEKLPPERRYDAIFMLLSMESWCTTRSALFFLYNLHESLLHVPSERRDEAKAMVQILLQGMVLCFDKPKWPAGLRDTRGNAGLYFKNMMIAAKATIVLYGSLADDDGEDAFLKWGSALSSDTPSKGPRIRYKQSLHDAFID